MELKISEILSVSGTPGLFKYVAQANGGVIVEALDGSGKRMRIAGSAKVSALGDIAIFTQTGELSLGEVFDMTFKAHNGEQVAITSKSTPAELAAFMSGVLKDYDTERVHNSDIKKLAQWYNVLVKAGMTSFAEVEDDASAESAKGGAKKSAVKDAVKAASKPKAVAAKGGAASSKSKAATGKSTTARKAQ